MTSAITETSPAVQIFGEFTDARSLYYGLQDGVTECGARVYKLVYTDRRLDSMLSFDETTRTLTFNANSPDEVGFYLACIEVSLEEYLYVPEEEQCFRLTVTEEAMVVSE